MMHGIFDDACGSIIATNVRPLTFGRLLAQVHDPAPCAAMGLKTRINCYTFRATGITAYMDAGGTLENSQRMAAHESPRTTKLYDRTGDAITLDEVKRIRIEG
jgi:hypothetical protein